VNSTCSSLKPSPANPLSIASTQRMLPDIRGEHGGVIGVEQVLMLKSPARRSRAGLGVQGVAGMVSLSR
jgi:hypothetical protein